MKYFSKLLPILKNMKLKMDATKTIRKGRKTISVLPAPRGYIFKNEDKFNTTKASNEKSKIGSREKYVIKIENK